jgi:hypothetical protein
MRFLVPLSRNVLRAPFYVNVTREECCSLISEALPELEIAK